MKYNRIIFSFILFTVLLVPMIVPAKAAVRTTLPPSNYTNEMYGFGDPNYASSGNIYGPSSNDLYSQTFSNFMTTDKLRADMTFNARSNNMDHQSGIIDATGSFEFDVSSSVDPNNIWYTEDTDIGFREARRYGIYEVQILVNVIGPDGYIKDLSNQDGWNFHDQTFGLSYKDTEVVNTNEMGYLYPDHEYTAEDHSSDETTAEYREMMKYGVDKLLEYVPYGNYIQTGVNLFDKLYDFSPGSTSEVPWYSLNENTGIPFARSTFRIPLGPDPPGGPNFPISEEDMAFDSVTFSTNFFPEQLNYGPGLYTLDTFVDVEFREFHSHFDQIYGWSDWHLTDPADPLREDPQTLRISKDLQFAYSSSGTGFLKQLEVVDKAHGSVSVTHPNGNSWDTEIGDDKNWYLVYGAGADMRLTPNPDTNYNFVGWKDTDGNFINSNTYSTEFIGFDGNTLIIKSASAMDANNRLYKVEPVYEYVPPNTDPSLSFYAPSSGSTVSGSVTIKVVTSDENGINYVDFYVAGSYIGSDSSPNSNGRYTKSFNSNNYANGWTEIRATSYDNTGKSTTSTIWVNIYNAPDPDPVPPPPEPCFGIRCLVP